MSKSKLLEQFEIGYKRGGGRKKKTYVEIKYISRK